MHNQKWQEIPACAFSPYKLNPGKIYFCSYGMFYIRHLLTKKKKSEGIKELGDRKRHYHFILKTEGIYPAGQRSRITAHLCRRVLKNTFSSFQENSVILCSCFQAIYVLVFNGIKILYFI